MRPLRRPVLHGRRVPAPGDQNVATLRDAVRHHLLVNALVFAGVLVIVLAAVETERRIRTPSS
jgi:hypothetical protein